MLPASASGRGRQVRRLVGLACIGVVFVVLAIRATQRPGIDFQVLYRTGGAFRSRSDLYAIPSGIYGYRYAPGIAPLFTPLSYLSFRTALTVWIAISALIAFAVALVLSRQFGARRPLAVPLAWACLLQPLAQELSHGQVDVLVLGLAVAAFEAEDSGRELLAGALVALAAGLKVAPVLLVIDWILRRRWRPFAGVLAAAVLSAMVVVWHLGMAGAIEQHARWYETQSADVSGMIETLGNQSLWSLARHLGLGTAGGAVASLALLAVAISAPARTRRQLLLATVPLVSAYGWPQLFILAIPLLSQILAEGKLAAWMAAFAAVAVSLLSYDVAGQHVEGWAQEHRLFTVFLITVVLAGRSLRAATPACGMPSR